MSEVSELVCINDNNNNVEVDWLTLIRDDEAKDISWRTKVQLYFV